VVSDAASEEALEKAGILNASMLVATLNNDSENIKIYTALIARKPNPDIQIIARANLESSIDKLYRAGADYVLSLSSIGAKMLMKLIEEEKLIDEKAIMMH
jgi:Trk K+ transport system NAD-binding subunit